jgi:hypothetical protein
MSRLTQTQRWTKKGKTEKENVTQLEKMNQHANTLADYPYEAQVVELETSQLPTRKNCCQIRKNNRVLSGNWRKQTLEEIRIKTRKKWWQQTKRSGANARKKLNGQE